MTTRIYARPGSAPTKRELEVAVAVLEADTLAQAAADLGVSEWTVRMCLANLRVRVNARHNLALFYQLRDHLAA